MKLVCSECGRDWKGYEENHELCEYQDGYTLCCDSAWGSPRRQIEPDDLVTKKKIFYDVEALLVEVRKLCKIIVDSHPNTIIKGEIESLAFYIGHHPFVMNGVIKEVENDR